MFCKYCNHLMKKVMRFEDGKSYRFYRCPKCYAETKLKRLLFLDEQIRRKNSVTNKSKKLIRKRLKRKGVSLYDNQ